MTRRQRCARRRQRHPQRLARAHRIDGAERTQPRAAVQSAGARVRISDFVYDRAERGDPRPAAAARHAALRAGRRRVAPGEPRAGARSVHPARRSGPRHDRPAGGKPGRADLDGRGQRRRLHPQRAGEERVPAGHRLRRPRHLRAAGARRPQSRCRRARGSRGLLPDRRGAAPAGVRARRRAADLAGRARREGAPRPTSPAQPLRCDREPGDPRRASAHRRRDRGRRRGGAACSVIHRHSTRIIGDTDKLREEFPDYFIS